MSQENFPSPSPSPSVQVSIKSLTKKVLLNSLKHFVLHENIPCPSPSPNVQVPIKSFTKMKGPVKQLKETLYYRRIFHTWEQCEKLISEKKVGGSILNHPPSPYHFCN